MTTPRDPVHLVAVGDSQSEGIGDPLDLRARRHGGFVNRLVDAWRAVPGVDFPLTNLAVAGARLADMRRDQLAPALAARPDLVILVGGVNDARKDTSADEVAEHYDAMLTALLAAGTTVVTSRHPDLVDHVTLLSDARKLVLREGLGRVRRAMDAVVDAQAAAREGGRLLVLDLDDVPVDASLFSVDQLHMDARGHALYAQQVADLLAEHGWRHVEVPVPTPGRRETAAHLGWLLRRYGPRMIGGLVPRRGGP